MKTVKEIVNQNVNSAIIEIENQNAESEKAMNAIKQGFIYSEHYKALKQWEIEGCKGNKPEKEDFASAWDDSIKESQNSKNKDIQAFADEVKKDIKERLSNL